MKYGTTLRRIILFDFHGHNAFWKANEKNNEINSGL